MTAPFRRRTLARAVLAVACGGLLVVGCAGGRESTPATTGPATGSTASASPTSTAAPPEPATSSSVPPATTTRTTVAATTTSSTTAAPPPTTGALQVTAVTTPGPYDGRLLEIHLSFRSEVDDVTTDELEATAMAILTDSRGWGASGFSFVVDGDSDLTVVLAEPARVDELCLPLTTGGYASCQNGAVVALNAERWRTATEDWDSTVAAYRRYLVNHEVGHLIGLRHPVERCPEGEPTSAVMEPQTAGLEECTGNGLPLDWEHDWASNRPAVIAPLPEWDGPRPEWP